MNERTNELLSLAMPGALGLSEIVDGFEEPETYFACSAGLIIRVLRSLDLFEGSQTAFIQFFDSNGDPISSHLKNDLSPGLFFARFGSLNFSRIYRLRDKPSFVLTSNIARLKDIMVDENQLSSIWKMGIDYSPDFG